MTPSKDAPPSSFGDILKAYPWLGVLLALSLIVTLWAATRRAPPPEPIPPAIEPAAEVPAPIAEADPGPTVWPDFAPPASETVAPAAEPAADMNTPLTQSEDGTWRGPALAKPQN